MQTMTLNEFKNHLAQKTQFIIEENDYNMLITIFENDYTLSPKARDYFGARVNYWKNNNINEGSEPFYWPEHMKIPGNVQFGLIKN